MTEADTHSQEHARTDNLLERLEKQVATLVVAYTEMWSVISTLLRKMFQELPEDQHEKWEKTLQDVRHKVYSTLVNASHDDLERADPDLASALVDLVTKHPSEGGSRESSSGKC